jgi:hypothetical protein
LSAMCLDTVAVLVQLCHYVLQLSF